MSQVVIVIICYLDLHLPMQPVPINNKVESSTPGYLYQ